MERENSQWLMVNGQLTPDCGPTTVDCGLWTDDCGLPTPDYAPALEAFSQSTLCLPFKYLTKPP